MTDLNVHFIQRINDEFRTRNELTLWTIYIRPSDHPDCFVARCFTTGKGKEATATDHHLTSKSLESLRTDFYLAGLTPVRRYPGDDPAIVETWL